MPRIPSSKPPPPALSTPLGVEGPAFDIDSDGTTIQCLTIRHADYGIDASGNSLTVLEVRVLHASSDAV